jgi:hypothetical protein
MRNDETTKTAEQPNVAPVDQQRREALHRLGRFGAYTAPALIAMLTSDKAAAKIS